VKQTVLVIKLGYCETLVQEEGFTPSLGDVFRHTVLLHHYAQHNVTWLTSEAAVPILQDNPLIHELLVYDDNVKEKLAKRTFDEVLCLEKAPVLCSLAATVKASRRMGFGLAGKVTRAYPGAETAVAIANGQNHFLPIQALLYQMVGDYWNGQDYVLGYQPRPRPSFDVGLNFNVGQKWPSKAWPLSHWQELAQRCDAAGWSVSWQEGTGDLETYMDWINAGRLIVTCDSLGMHLGLALQKKIIALFGPTPSEHIHMYGRGVILRADWSCRQAPCMNECCAQADDSPPFSDLCGPVCMSEITPAIVARTAESLLRAGIRRSSDTPSTSTTPGLGRAA
jgi:heptosyltransferase-2